MSGVEKLRNSRESYAIKLRDFLRIVGRRAGAIVCFFEGEDAKYYAHRIELIAPSLQWEGVNAGGKSNVIKLHQIIAQHPTHSKTKTAYFLDRDYGIDAFPTASNVYVTPCYSVENLYVSEQVMRRILKQEFQLSEFSEEDNSFECCLEAFLQRLNEFLGVTEALNAWIFLQRQKEIKEAGTTILNLSSINLARHITIQLDRVVSHYTIEELEVSDQATIRIPEKEVTAVISSFCRAEDRANFFRGKFQAHFMRSFLTKLREDASADTPRFLPTRRISLNVSERNFLSDLCQYADTPDCLRCFLSSLSN